MTRTVIVGAGVAGLATAALLARQGHDVEVFERGDAIGGRAGSLRGGARRSLRASFSSRYFSYLSFPAPTDTFS